MRINYSSDTHKRMDNALRLLYANGHRTISAGTLADELWPYARRSNANGQTFNLCAGVAGGMLRGANASLVADDGSSILRTELKGRKWKLTLYSPKDKK